MHDKRTRQSSWNGANWRPPKERPSNEPLEQPVTSGTQEQLKQARRETEVRKAEADSAGQPKPSAGSDREAAQTGSDEDERLMQNAQARIAAAGAAFTAPID